MSYKLYITMYAIVELLPLVLWSVIIIIIIINVWNWLYICMQYLFSSPELEAVRFTDQLSSVLCLSVHCLSFHIFNFFSRTSGPISTKLGTKHSWVKKTQCLEIKNHSILVKEIRIFFFLNQCYGLIILLCKCDHWMELHVSQA